MKTRIDFETKLGKFYVVVPTQQNTMDADLVYKTNYSEALRCGALTASEGLGIIDSRKLWNEDDKKKVADLLMEVYKMGEELKKEASLTKGLELITEIEDKRVEILRTNLKRNAVLDNTAESYADEQRLQFYIVECTYDADDKRIYKDKTELVAASNDEHTVLATKFLIYLISNEGEDFRKDWPDYQWRGEHGLIDENMDPVREFPTEFQEKLNAEAEAQKPKKKRAKKKTAKKS